MKKNARHIVRRWRENCRPRRSSRTIYEQITKVFQPLLYKSVAREAPFVRVEQGKKKNVRCNQEKVDLATQKGEKPGKVTTKKAPEKGARRNGRIWHARLGRGRAIVSENLLEGEEKKTTMNRDRERPDRGGKISSSHVLKGGNPGASQEKQRRRFARKGNPDDRPPKKSSAWTCAQRASNDKENGVQLGGKGSRGKKKGVHGKHLGTVK